MVNLRSSSLQRNNLGTFRSNHLNNYFETVLPIILAALWTICILWAISVLLRTITIINFNCALENLRTMDDFNFANFLIDRVMECFTKGASYCCCRKVVSNNYFLKVLLINFISTCPDWLKNFSFTHFLLIKGLWWKVFCTKRVAHCTFRRVV